LYRPIGWHLNGFFVRSPAFACRDYIT